MFISYPSRFEELCQDKTVEFLAGGATQNAMKVAQVSPNGYFEPNYADRILRMFLDNVYHNAPQRLDSY